MATDRFFLLSRVVRIKADAKAAVDLDGIERQVDELRQAGGLLLLRWNAQG